MRPCSSDDLFRTRVLVLSIGVAFCCALAFGTASAGFEGVEVVESTPSQVRLRLTVPEPEIRAVPQSAEVSLFLEGWGLTEEVGAPEVPVRSLSVGVPAGSTPRLTVNVLSSRTIPGAIPRPAPRRWIETDEADLPIQGEVREREPRAYASAYPSQWARLESLASLRHLQIVPVRIHPFRWDPERNAVSMATELEIIISWDSAQFRPLENSRPPAQDHPSWDRTYENSVVNWDQARSFRRSPSSWQSTRFSRNSAGEGPRFKFEITKSGLYAVSFEELESAGWDLGSIPVEQLALEEFFFDETDEKDPFHIVQVPIDVGDYSEDGFFDEGDEVWFYAESAWDRLAPHPRDKRFGRKHCYFLTTRPEGGARMVREGSHLGLELDSEEDFSWSTHEEGDGNYMDTHAAGESATPLENGVLNIIAEHFYWIGRQPREGDDFYTISYDLPGYVGIEELRIRFQGLTDPRHPGRNLLWTGADDASVVRLPDAHVPVIQSVDYRLTGDDLAKLNLQLAPAGNLLKMQIPFGEFGAAIDYMEFDYRKAFSATGSRLEWDTDGASGSRQYDLRGFDGNDIYLFEVSDPRQPKRLLHDPGQTERVEGKWRLRVQFETDGVERRFFVAESSAPMRVDDVTRTSANDLKADGTHDLIVITHSNFREEIEPLIQRRESQGWNVFVADVEEVFDQFNGGREWPVAIRNYLRYLFRTRDVDPSFVLLVGDASEDFAGVLAPESDPSFVPTQTLFSNAFSSQGTELIATDVWFVDNLVGTGEILDFYPDAHIGRLPVGDSEEATNLVEKILQYEDFRDTDQWRNRALVAADDEFSSRITFDQDNYRFNGDPRRDRPRSGESVFVYAGRRSKELIQEEAGFTDFAVDSFYVYSYLDTVACLERCVRDENVDCSDWTCEVNDAGLLTNINSRQIEPNGWGRNQSYFEEQDFDGNPTRFYRHLQDQMSRGFLWVAFQSHANRALAAHEGMWRDAPHFRFDSEGLDNVGKPFIFMGFGCHMADFAPHHEGLSNRGDSLTERMLFLDRGRGAVASVASTGYEWLSENAVYHLALLESWYKNPPTDSAGHSRWLLGPLIDGGKFEMLNSGGNRGMIPTYALHGDPTMPVDIAPPRIDQVQINGEEWEEGTALFAVGSDDTAEIEVWLHDEVWIENFEVRVAGTAVDPREYTVLPDPSHPESDRHAILQYHPVLDVPAEDYEIEITGVDRVGRSRHLALSVEFRASFEIDDGGTFVPLDNGGFVQFGDRVQVRLESPILHPSSEIEVWLGTARLDLVSATPEGGGGEESRVWLVEVQVGDVGEGGPYSLEARLQQHSTNGYAARRVSVNGASVGPIDILTLYNFPNPFEGTTSFYFEIDGPARAAKLTVYTLRGQKIFTEELDGLRAGLTQVAWEGRDRDGDELANGVYFYKLEVESLTGDKVSKIERLARVR